MDDNTTTNNRVATAASYFLLCSNFIAIIRRDPSPCASAAAAADDAPFALFSFQHGCRQPPCFLSDPECSLRSVPERKSPVGCCPGGGSFLSEGQRPISSRASRQGRMRAVGLRASRKPGRTPLFCRWAAWPMNTALNESLWLALPASQRPRFDKPPLPEASWGEGQRLGQWASTHAGLDHHLVPSPLDDAPIFLCSFYSPSNNMLS